MMKLKGKVAIVTGAGSGMGKAIANVYALEGAKVVVSDINEITAAQLMVVGQHSKIKVNASHIL